MLLSNPELLNTRNLVSSKWEAYESWYKLTNSCYQEGRYLFKFKQPFSAIDETGPK